MLTETFPDRRKVALDATAARRSRHRLRAQKNQRQIVTTRLARGVLLQLGDHVF
jgi:urease accessory protein UreE